MGITQGETEEEARDMAAGAIRTMIREHIRKGEEIPCPSRPRGRKYCLVHLAALDAAKVELYSTFQASGLKKVELVRRLGIPKTAVDRLFDLDHHSRLDHIEAAFAVVGKRLAVTVQDAA